MSWSLSRIFSTISEGMVIPKHPVVSSLTLATNTFFILVSLYDNAVIYTFAFVCGKLLPLFSCLVGFFCICCTCSMCIRCLLLFFVVCVCISFRWLSYLVVSFVLI